MRMLLPEALLSMLLIATLAGGVRAELTVLDKPMWIFPGQTFRIALEQPAGAGELRVDVPGSVELYDQWAKDTIQRFYLRALKPGDATLKFTGKGGELEIPLEVIPWSELFQPRTWEGIQLPRIWPLDDPEYAELKARRTCYTEEELARMRASGAEPEALAQRWREMSDEEVFSIIPGSWIPRACLIVMRGSEDPRGKGCPVCGTKIYEGRSGFYPWVFDDEKHPWKVGCPSCGTWFPSNDWANGDMHSGDFPDDGYGCEPAKPVIAPNGKAWRWPFIAYYHQWQRYMRNLTPAIEQCARAFAVTGDPVYAHKAAVGLFRWAESNLDMALNLKHRKIPISRSLYGGPVGAPNMERAKRLPGSFLYIQPNWDTRRMENCARAWDLIFDQIEGDEELLRLCRAQHHPEIRTAEDFRRFIDAGVLRVPAQACLDNAVARNWPMQEAALATLALALGTPRSLEMVDWVLNEGGGLRFSLTNEYFKDGSGHESESYNGIQIRDMNRIIQTLERFREVHPDRYKPPRFISLLHDPKYRQLYDFPLENSLIGRTFPGTGDCGQSVAPDPWPPRQGFPLREGDLADVYRVTRDPRFAQAMYGPDGDVPSALHEPELRAEVERIGRERGWQVPLRSRILDGYGHAILCSGEGDYQRALWVRYGRVVQHIHWDMLTMGLEALQRRMLPELGYPQGWTFASVWETNWGTHYGTHITGFPTSGFARGAVSLFADSAPAQVAWAESDFRDGEGRPAKRARTIVLVDLSDRDCYAVTLETVAGGTEHTWSFHGPQGEATPFGVALTPQGGGTVLHPDVEYGDDSPVRKVDAELSCLAFMYDPQRGRPEGVWGIDYRLKDQGGVGLRMTMVQPDGSELAVARGKPPGGTGSYEMTWAILQRRGEDALTSRFLTVLEPYEGTPRIQEVERVPLTGGERNDPPPLGLRVTTAEYVDTIIFSWHPGTEVRTGDGLVCDGTFGFWRLSEAPLSQGRERRGKAVAAVLAVGTELSKGEHRVTLDEAMYRGRIERCDWEGRRLIISPAPADIAGLTGRHIRIHNDAGSDASYIIEAAEAVPGGCAITLGLDPRIGEGYVEKCEDGCVLSGVRLRLATWGYYAGKTLANEDGTAVYHLRDVEGRSRCVIDTGDGDPLPAAKLASEFNDRDGDGFPRYLIYDYGPGDEVTISNWKVQQFAQPPGSEL